MKIIIVSIYSMPDDNGLGDKEVYTLGDILDFAASRLDKSPHEIEIMDLDGVVIPWNEWQRPATNYFADGSRVNVQEVTNETEFED